MVTVFNGLVDIVQRVYLFSLQMHACKQLLVVLVLVIVVVLNLDYFKIACAKGHVLPVLV